VKLDSIDCSLQRISVLQLLPFSYKMTLYRLQMSAFIAFRKKKHFFLGFHSGAVISGSVLFVVPVTT